MQLVLLETRLGLRNSATRIPFRYGSACLTRCPQAILAATIEVGGRVQTGFSGDCFPPGWFDKTSGRGFAAQIEDMLASIGMAERICREEMNRPTALFPAWLAAGERVQAEAAARGLTPLLASFGLSMVERAVIDALARRAGVSLFQALQGNLFGIEPGRVHPELQAVEPADWLPSEPRRWLYVRHTVGLSDPLTAADVPPGERLEDGFPQTLEEYVGQTGTRYFKIKVSNRLEHDLDRLRAIARIVEHVRGSDYAVTLDGNEQYQGASEFDELIEAIERDESLRRLWRNTLLVEQPLDRRIALDEGQTSGIRTLSDRKPVIIDESDGTLDAFRRAMALGYRGVSSKNCKGPLKSLLNLGLCWRTNQRLGADRYLMTGEDLCTVGIVPVQADLCLVAALGLEHVERNGHHFHPGLSYLPPHQQAAALEAHPDFYCRRHGRVAPWLNDGKFQIGSLQCAGFGFAVEPDFSGFESPAEWQFASLGLGEP